MSFEKRGGFPQRLGDVLPGFLQKVGPKGLWIEARIRKVWAEALGAKLAEHVNVGRLKGRTLVVFASSDVWANEFRYMADMVRERVNARLGEEIVEEITVYRARRRPER